MYRVYLLKVSLNKAVHAYFRKNKNKKTGLIIGKCLLLFAENIGFRYRLSLQSILLQILVNHKCRHTYQKHSINSFKQGGRQFDGQLGAKKHTENNPQRHQPGKHPI